MVRNERTGEAITTVMDVDIHVNVKNVVTAEMTMLAGTDGLPLPEGAKPVRSDDGEPRTGVFWWYVTEIRTERAKDHATATA
jgi:hypothetical protein